MSQCLNHSLFPDSLFKIPTSKLRNDHCLLWFLKLVMEVCMKILLNFSNVVTESKNFTSYSTQVLRLLSWSASFGCLLKLVWLFAQELKYICPNCLMYLSLIAKCIFANYMRSDCLRRIVSCPVLARVAAADLWRRVMKSGKTNFLSKQPVFSQGPKVPAVTV